MRSKDRRKEKRRWDGERQEMRDQREGETIYTKENEETKGEGRGGKED